MSTSNKLTKKDYKRELTLYNIKLSGTKKELEDRYNRLKRYELKLKDFRYGIVSEKYLEEITEELHKNLDITPKDEVLDELEEKMSKLEIKETCCICMEEMKDEHTIKCGHKFHKDCITRWFKECSSCPICRTECCKTKKRQNISEGYYENMRLEYGLEESESEFEEETIIYRVDRECGCCGNNIVRRQRVYRPCEHLTYHYDCYDTNQSLIDSIECEECNTH